MSPNSIKTLTLTSLQLWRKLDVDLDSQRAKFCRIFWGDYRARNSRLISTEIARRVTLSELRLPIPTETDHVVGTRKRSATVRIIPEYLRKSETVTKRRFKRTLKTARRLQKQTLCGMDAAEEPTRMYSRRVCVVVVCAVCHEIRTESSFINKAQSVT